MVALVTGGSRGIGRALCAVLRERGYRVYWCSRSEPDDIPEGTFIPCDVSDPESVRAMFERFGEQEERLHLLVNNAAVLGPRAELEQVDIDAWRRTFAVNVDGPFLVTKAALPFLRAAAGTICNVSSSVGRTGRGSWGPYGCSKHALEGMTDTFADELADDDVMVFSVNPGGTATDMRAEAYPEEDPATLPTAAEVAAVIAEMCETAESRDKLNVRDRL
jgi:NAD(P)-dependent dehydrogenase (short-subunit alcohol dehydrogenase family)